MIFFCIKAKIFLENFLQRGFFALENLKNIFKGVILGISNIIPGVSAGTMAIILGIYDRLLSSISGIFKNFKSNFRFLFFIGIGVLGGILFFSGVLEKLLEKFPWQMNYLFIGLIAGGIKFLFKMAVSYRPKNFHYIYLILTFGILIAMRFMTPATDVKIIVSLNFQNIIFLILSGFVAAGAMILPGVSGSFILILFGMYNSIISAVSNFNILVLFPFGIGVLLGLVIMVKVIEFLLKKFPAQSYMAIIGLIFGSIVSIFPGFEFSIKGLSCVIVFAVGFFVSYFISVLDSK